jgi:hypothetical protein
MRAINAVKRVAVLAVATAALAGPAVAPADTAQATADRAAAAPVDVLMVVARPAHVQPMADRHVGAATFKVAPCPIAIPINALSTRNWVGRQDRPVAKSRIRIIPFAARAISLRTIRRRLDHDFRTSNA